MNLPHFIGDRKYFIAELTYAFLSSLFYGIISVASILGLFGYYRMIPAIIFTAVVTLCMLYLYLKSDRDRLVHNILLREDSSKNFSLFHALTYIGALTIFVVIVMLPIVRWPESPVSGPLFHDVAAYHFPKAIELYRSGSIWDLSIPFGEYPFGYESLLTFSMYFSGNENYYGVVSAIIGLYFCLTVWLLLCRYSRINPSLLIIFAVFIFVGGILAPSRNISVSSFSFEDPFIFLYYQFTLVGQNDLILGASVLAMVLHAPIGNATNRTINHPFGLAIASAIAMSIKPNAILVVLFTFVLVVILAKQRKNLNYYRLMGTLGVMLPGVLWIVRNLLCIGVPFGSGTNMMKWSIGYNLTNPYLYDFTPTFNLIIPVLAVILVSLLGWGIIKSPNGGIVITLVFLFVTFIFTPATAFHVVTNVPSHIQWRLGIALLCFSLIVFIALLDPLIRKPWFIISSKVYLSIPVALLFIYGTYWIFHKLQWMQRSVSENRIILEDQFIRPIGSNGYRSAYDFARKNIQNSVILLVNGQPYYLYGPGFTNTPTNPSFPYGYDKLVTHPRPNYSIAFSSSSDFLKDNGKFPESISSENWLAEWNMIYQDSVGRVYKRK